MFAAKQLNFGSFCAILTWKLISCWLVARPLTIAIVFPSRGASRVPVGFVHGLVAGARPEHDCEYADAASPFGGARAKLVSPALCSTRRRALDALRQRARRTPLCGNVLSLDAATRSRRCHIRESVAGELVAPPAPDALKVAGIRQVARVLADGL